MVGNVLKMLKNGGNKVPDVFMSLEINARNQKEALDAKVYRKCRIIMRR